MQLWLEWFNLVKFLRTAFSRQKTFLWFIAILIGFTIKFDSNGVTSLARGIGLAPCYYTCMLHWFRSTAIDFEKIMRLWVKLVVLKFNTAVRLNGKLIILGDGIKIAKEGKKMPGVKLLHQDSQNNSKSSYIMGHSIQVASFLVKGLSGFISVPLGGEIHEGFEFNSKNKLTLLDKMIKLLQKTDIQEPYYFIADKYYCSGRFLKQLIKSGGNIITMMKKNAVAYYPAIIDYSKKGRRKKYGEKVKIFDLFDNASLAFTKAAMPNETSIIIEYCSLQLLWRPLGELVQLILVKHPNKGNCVVMTTDLNLPALDAITGYCYRFKIEVMFKQSVHQIRTFMYHFWSKMLAPTKKGSGDKQWQFAPKKVKKIVRNKQRAYNLFINCGLIAQGLLQYLAINYSKQVWNGFGSWLRTIRLNVVPSEKVVSLSMSKSFWPFIADDTTEVIFKKFIRERIDIAETPELNLKKDLAA